MYNDNPPRQGLSLLRADLESINLSRRGGGSTRMLPNVRMIAVALFRTTQTLGTLSPVLAALVKQLNHVITGADIAWQASAGPGLQLQHPTGVVIGPHVVIGSNVVLAQGVTLGALDGANADRSSPTIGEGVLVGAGARILGPVAVGDYARVGANAVVLKNVPAGAVAVGVPARIIERDGRG